MQPALQHPIRLTPSRKTRNFKKKTLTDYESSSSSNTSVKSEKMLSRILGLDTEVRVKILRKASEVAPIVSVVGALSQSSEVTPIKLLNNQEDELSKTRSFARRSGLAVSEIFRDPEEDDNLYQEADFTDFNEDKENIESRPIFEKNKNRKFMGEVGEDCRKSRISFELHCEESADTVCESKRYEDNKQNHLTESNVWELVDM